jgi:signal transduction histidine kinase
LKNKFWKFSVQFMILAVVSILLSALIIVFALWAAYKLFDSESLRSVAQQLYRVSNIFLFYDPAFVIVSLIVLLAGFLNCLFTNRTTKRMSAVHNAVLQIQQGEYHVLLPNDNNDSLGELEHNINALAIQISDALNQRKEVERSKGDFIVNLAHDLRTPLTSIIGYLSFIGEKQLDPEISAKYAGAALAKSRQLERLMESLFDIAHFTMDEIPIDREELNLKKFLLQKRDELYPLTSSADMEIRLALSDQAPTIHADGVLMARVFDNLINNAIRYAKEGRYIDIEAEALRDKVRISFLTHANPVPADELERIFDKLYRLEKSRATGTGGTGLGLSISRGIIELHGGTLTARQAGNGTAFDIILPK